MLNGATLSLKYVVDHEHNSNIPNFFEKLPQNAFAKVAEYGNRNVPKFVLGQNWPTARRPYFFVGKYRVGELATPTVTSAN